MGERILVKDLLDIAIEGYCNDPLSGVSGRLLKKIRYDENGCWISLYGIRNTGYPAITVPCDKFERGYTSDDTHRAAYREWVGSIPEGMCVCHKCNNKRCINPEHLYLDTIAGNSRKAAEDGLYCSGEQWYEVERNLPKGNNHWARKYPDKVRKGEHCNRILTEREVNEIRSKYIPRIYSQYKLAKEYGVDRSTISDILAYRIWKHI